MQPHGVWMGEGYVLVFAVMMAALCLPVLRRLWRMDEKKGWKSQKNQQNSPRQKNEKQEWRGPRASPLFCFATKRNLEMCTFAKCRTSRYLS